MSDPVERAAVIDALGWCNEWDVMGFTVIDKDDAIRQIKSLPSAEPVITCDGCRFVGIYDTDFPCCSCVRREKDYYEPER